MSRLTRLSPEAIRAMFSSESDQTLIMLLTIYDPANESQVVFRFADNYTQRITSLTTDEEVVYGVPSRGNDYAFLPMELSLPSEQDTGVGSCTLKLQYVIREAIEECGYEENLDEYGNPEEQALEEFLSEGKAKPKKKKPVDAKKDKPKTGKKMNSGFAAFIKKAKEKAKK